MPKQVWKIERFDGGLNTGADPRDIDVNELAAAVDIAVDDIGKITSMGSFVAHDAGANKAAITAGYGLHYFSHDRINAHLSGNHLDEPDLATHVEWDRTGDVSDSGVTTVETLTPTPSSPWEDSQTHSAFVQTSSSGSGASMYVTAVTNGAGVPTFAIKRSGIGFVVGETIVFTDPGSTSNTATLTVASVGISFSFELDTGTSSTTSSIAGTAQQSYSDRIIAGTSGAEYSFTYTVVVRTAPNNFTLTLGNFPTSGVTMPFTAGTHTVTFTSHASASTRHFTITAADDVDTTTTQGEIIIDDLLLQRIGTADDAETGDDYLVMADADAAANLDIYSSTNDVWGVEAIDLGSTTGMKPVFYNADGALRVSDGNFGAANQNKWFGYIKQTHFNGITPGGAADAYDSWYTKSLDLAKPTKGLYGQTVAFTDTTAAAPTTQIEFQGTTTNDFVGWTITGDGYIATDSDSNSQARIISGVTSGNDSLTTETNSDGWGGESIRIFPPAGSGWNVYLKQSSTTGSWPGQDYQVGTTFIYQGNQESEILNISERPNASRLESIASGFAIDFAIYATSPYDPFLIGGRVYVRKFGTDDAWVLLADISLVNGVRTDLTSDYTAWSLDGSVDNAHNNAPDNVYCYVESMTAVDPSPWTYEAINGYRSDESVDIGAAGEGFKTAVVANRQTYIGNVRREHLDGITRTEGDAMYKSMPGKFDTFPFARKIEASVQDGDEIVKLEEYADRILQFKKHKMHLINISQDLEFLEDTFIHKGILVPNAACKTDFGIAWANENGCYLYDGKGVRNLLEKKGMQVVKESTWRSFLGAAPMVGYAPKERQLIIGKTAGSEGVGDIFLYDMVSQSWVQGDSKFTDSKKQTNLVVDWDHDLVHAHSNDVGTVLKWDATPVTTTAISFKTKDIDFGQPAVRKKIYKVYVSYKGDGGEITVNYGTNGNSTMTGQFYITGSSGASTKANAADLCIYNGDVGTNDWVLAELRPSSSINNIYSFQLKFDGGTTDANFEINDISIVYRVKNIK